jgi:hypothetical protein
MIVGDLKEIHGGERCRVDTKHIFSFATLPGMDDATPSDTVSNLSRGLAAGRAPCPKLTTQHERLWRRQREHAAIYRAGSIAIASRGGRPVLYCS